MIKACLTFWMAIVSLITLGQTTFSKLYWNDYTISGLGIATDGEFVYSTGLGLYNDDELYLPNVFFLKFDVLGNQIDKTYLIAGENAYYRSGYAGGFELLNDSILFASGHFSEYDTMFPPWNRKHLGQLYAFNTEGDTLFTRKYKGSGFIEFNRLHLFNDKVICGGFTQDTNGVASNAYLTKVNYEGIQIWELMLGDTIHSEATGLLDTISNSTIIGGGAVVNSISPDGIMRNGKIYKLDASGNVYFSKEIGTPYDDSEIEVKVSKNGQSYLVRQYMDTVINEGDYEYVQYIGKTDTNVNFIWRTFLNDKYYKYIYTLRTFEDGSIVAVGTTIVDETYEPHGYIVKLDSNGAVLWERDYTNNPEGNHYLYDFQKMPDGGYICSGLGADTIDGVIQSMCWLLRLDSMGCLIPGCDEVSIPEIAVNSETYLSIYPNPFGDAATVEVHVPQDFTINGTQALRLDIYDMQGRLIDGYSNIYPSNPGETIRFKMYRNTMTAGNYLATLKYGDEVLNTIQFVLK
ncbi:MAG TPA: T9SS type A sorting domain-containing protein [Chitinophagales bacterium]|nr:T9SS type A sorting domain-containing protein [Chitinophagales bacterium]HMX04511.1 T9SS type A sorting domain-containing protein [Chitinophagales bacterium]HMZ90504.1 T9SS type A sorting domain-containing protein [Chitinophagales bacterium]HNE46655.1 T9SS type A sorting domain-containing protein [Chitinophagales bacterium]HNF68784.1 T9SS type A sorting domain-containing protein [Chitinophagales bacterium]